MSTFDVKAESRQILMSKKSQGVDVMRGSKLSKYYKSLQNIMFLVGKNMQQQDQTYSFDDAKR